MANASEVLAQFANLPLGPRVSDWHTNLPTTDGYNQAAADNVGVPYESQTADSNPLTANIGRTIGRNEYNRDKTAYRSDGQAVGDLVTGAINGLLGTVGDLGALGVGLVNDNAGAWTTQKVGEATSWVQSKQSAGLQLHRNAGEADNQASSAENQRIFERERQTKGDFVAGLAKVGRNFIDAVKNASNDQTMFSDGIANAAGSLLAGGPISKGFTLAGSKILGGLLSRGVVGEAAALKAAEIGGKLAMPATIGAMESGGVYQQTVQQVMGMKHEDLMQSSPDYANLIAQNWSHEDAKTEVATSAGLMAAAMQFPVAAAAGTLVSKFEGNPFRGLVSPLNVAKNGAKEAIEEAVQSGGGQLFGNVGVKTFANENQNLTDGVGEQAGLGALYGMGSAVGVETPGMAAHAAVGAAKLAGDAVIKGAKAAAGAVMDRAAQAKAANEAASPVGAYNLNVATEQALAKAPAIAENIQKDLAEGKLTPEQGASIQQHLTKLNEAMQWDPAELDSLPISDALKAHLATSTNKFDAIYKAAALAADKNAENSDRLDAGIFLNDLLNKNADLKDTLVKTREAAPDDHPYLNQLYDFEDVIQKFEQNPEVQKARQKAQELMSRVTAAAVSEQAVSTPEGQRTVRQVASAVQSDPTAVSGDVADLVLEHARKGKVTLTDAQTRSLKVSSALQRVDNTYTLTAKRNNLKPDWVKVVNAQILTDLNDKNSGELSAAGHVRAIMQAYNRGDREAAAQAMSRMMAFAKHMQNKVEGLNQAYLNGHTSSNNGYKFQALQPSGKFAPSLKGVNVSPRNAGSVRFAQNVLLEAQTLGNMANELALQMPELGVDPIDMANLHNDLQGNADKIAQDFKEGKRRVPVLGSSEATPTPTPEVKPEEPAKVEPAQAQPSTVETGSTATKADTVAEPAPQTDYSKEGTVFLKQELEMMDHVPSSGKVKTKTPEQQVRRDAIKAELDKRETATQPTKVEDKPNETPTKDSVPEQASPPAKDATQPESGTETETEKQTDPEMKTAQTIEQAFPNLVGAKNGKVIPWFQKAFRLPKTAKSRLLGTGLPAQFMRDALSGNKGLRAVLGKLADKRNLTHDLVVAYGNYLNLGATIVDAMNKRLDDYLAGEFTKGGQTRLDALINELNGKEYQLNEMLQGKVLNIVETAPDGSLRYNQELLQSAVLAGLQWMITGESNSREYDDEAVAKILGVEESAASRHLNWFNNGVWTQEAKLALTAAITRYWGLDTNPETQLGFTKGIAEAVAAEVFTGLENTGIIKTETRNILGQNYSRIVFNKDLVKEHIDPLRNFPTAIEEVAAIEPEGKNYVLTAPESVPTNQMHGSPVRLTTKAQKAEEAAQNIPHFLNTTMLAFVEMLDETGLVALFGKGDVTQTGLNKNTAESINGFNRTLLSAFGHLKNLVAEMDALAKTSGKDVSELPVFFRYGVSLVGRLQMLGRANPQASKLVREILLPTWSTLDLSKQDGEHYRSFLLAIAQHTGTKVHRDGVTASVKKVQEQLDNPAKFAPAVELLQDWLKSHDEGDALVMDPSDVVILKKALGDPLSVGAVHALMEYARYKNSDEGGKQAFHTGLYLEADGITDGPINALMNLTAGIFTPHWLDLMNRGGLYFSKGIKTLADFVTKSDKARLAGEDLYQKTTNLLAAALESLRLSISHKPGLVIANTALRGLMGAMLEDVTIKGDTVEFARGITKNPLTVTVYGSGTKGIAEKITAGIVEEIYAAMGSSGKLSPELMKYLNSLTTWRVYKKHGELKIFEVKDMNRKTGSGADFTLTKDMLSVLTSNVQYLFAEPLSAAINEMMGPALDTAQLVRKATQVQSILFKYAYREALDKALDAKGEIGSRNFLSQAELDKILQELFKKFPMIHSGAQVLWVGGSERQDNTDKKKTQYGAGLGGEFRTPGYIYAPQNSGVKGIPYLVISTGDGQMIMNVLTGENVPEGILPVFDGVNMKLDTLTSDSQRINQAVFEGWQENPLSGVRDSFNEFLSQTDLKELDGVTDPVMLEELEKALSNGPDSPGLYQPLSAYMMDLRHALITKAASLEARKAVLNRLNLSVDHMASAESPYVKTDGVDLPELAIDQVKLLNEMLREELEKLPEAEPFKPYVPVSEDLSDFINKHSDVGIGGTRVLELSALSKLVGELNIPLDQQGLVRASVESLQSNGWTVIHGTPEQLTYYASELGIALPSGIEGNEGIALPGSKTILMSAASSETLAHELIHATTIEQVHAYYEDPEGAHLQVARAVQRIERLRDEFLAISPDSITDQETRAAMMDARAAILEKLGNTTLSESVRKAAALNEFMAWTLANQKLADLARSTKVENPLAKIARVVLEMIKRLLWSKGNAPHAGEDIYSNLRFNTLTIMQVLVSQMRLGSAESLSSLAQYQSRSYGENDRLSKLEKNLNDRAASLSVNRETVNESEASRKAAAATQKSLIDARNLARKVTSSFSRADGFNMTHQESSLFETLVTAFAVDKELNSNAKSRAQELFQHVLKNLKVEDFMRDRDFIDEADRHQAQTKYDLVVGNFFVGKDAMSRSTLLPAFMGLAMVNDQFRAVLEGMNKPSTVTQRDGSLDNFLNHVGEVAMDRLGKFLSGQGIKDTNVKIALDMLTNRLAESDAERESFIEQFVAPAGNGMDKFNDWFVGIKDDWTQKQADKLETFKKTTDSKLKAKLANAGEAALGIFNADIGGNLAQGWIGLLDKSNAWKWVSELMSEVVGRTDENAPVFDMIKLVRAFIQQVRQRYREYLPEHIAKQFNREVSQDERTAIYHGIAKTDLTALHSLGSKTVMELVKDKAKRAAEIKKIEVRIDQLDAQYAGLLKTKARELAGYMITGKVSDNLLRNADAIALLLNEISPSFKTKRGTPSKSLVAAIDQLTSLYALDQVSSKQLDMLAELVNTEANGMEFVFNYLHDLRGEELAKSTTEQARLNRYKGHVATESRAGVSLIVADDAQHGDLVARGYTRAGNYRGSRAEGPGLSAGYYYAPLSGKSAFNQGIAQNIRHTFFGVDPVTGFSMENLGAGRITRQDLVRKIQARMHLNGKGNEPLVPVFDTDGNVMAFERSIDPQQLIKLEHETDMFKVMGIWRGRQVEEGAANRFNMELVKRLHTMWDKADFGRRDEFVNLLDPADHKDPVIEDAVKLFSPEMRRMIEDTFGADGFMVRKSMVNDTIGYRSPSIGDLWTGVTRLPPGVADTARDVLMAVHKDAYKYLVTAEKMWQNFVSDARTTIVVRSVIVPAANMVSNVYQLAARGVPLGHIVRGMSSKLIEVQTYHKNRIREVQLEAEISAAKNNLTKIKALKTELKSIQDSHRHLSIWPLIQAGEFSSVSEATVVREDTTLFEGNVYKYLEAKADKLPDAIKTAGRYAILSRDTALFQGLQRAVEYGDFLAKAVLYDDLTKRKKMDSKEAIAKIGEEYVNYDRMPGRLRGSMENMGILWFYHFKLRSLKVALSMVRNNPLHTLMVSALPTPDFLGSIGLPTQDNVISKAIQGKLGYSIGPLMGFHAHTLNPWANLVS